MFKLSSHLELSKWFYAGAIGLFFLFLYLRRRALAATDRRVLRFLFQFGLLAIFVLALAVAGWCFMGGFSKF